MKKLLYGAIALAGLFAVSCTKEADLPDATPSKNQVVLTFQASLDDATRTAYANEKTFSWLAGDEITVRLYDAVANTYSWVVFTTLEGGETADFSATVDEGLEFAGQAFYTFSDLDGTMDYSGVPNYFLPYSMDCHDLGDPLAVVPLLGTLDPQSSQFQFHTATGVLKISLKNIPDPVDGIVIVSNDGEALSGWFIPEDTDDSLSQLNADPDYSYNDIDIIPVIENGYADFYVPVPVGTLTAGFSVQFVANKAVVGSKETVKDVDFARNQFIVFPVIDVSEVVTLPKEPFDVPCSWDFDEEGSTLCWTFVDSDGDGFNWSLKKTLVNSGDYALVSASYDNDSSTALTPDNWAFTPKIQLTEGNCLSFYIRAVDSNYPEEHYAVYLAEGSPEGELTLLEENTFPDGDYWELGADGVYQRYVISIPPEFDNEVVCFAFRHYSCTDMYLLSIDDVAVLEEAPEPPALPDAEYADYLGEWTTGSKLYTIEEKETGVSYYITGIPGQGTYPVEAKFEDNALVLYEQVVEVKGSSATALEGLINGQTFGNVYSSIGTKVMFKGVYDATSDTITITPFNSFTHFIWISYMAEEYSGYGTYGAFPTVLSPYVPVPDTNTYLFQDGFETDAEGWSFFDADSDGYQWGITSSLALHWGDKALYSRSWINNTVGAVTPNNYAFTPGIALTTNNYLSFWVTASQNYPSEHYAVYVTNVEPTASNLPTENPIFEQTYSVSAEVGGSLVELGADGYQHYVVPIEGFDNQTVYVGFRHYNCSDWEYLLLDDVSVIEGTPVFGDASVAPAPAPKLAAPANAEPQDFRKGTSRKMMTISQEARR